MAVTVLLHLDADQPRFAMQPVYTTDAALPTAAHLGAPLFVRASNLALGTAAVAKRFPFLRSHPRQEGRVERIKEVQVGDAR